jgi:hypothetical protein
MEISKSNVRNLDLRSTFNLVGFTGSTGSTGGTGQTGQTGFTGRTGFTGHTGHTGFTGRTGFTGHTGFTGRTGFTGHTGHSGHTGFTGRTGFTGHSGRTGYTGFTGGHNQQSNVNDYIDYSAYLERVNRYQSSTSSQSSGSQGYNLNIHNSTLIGATGVYQGQTWYGPVVDDDPITGSHFYYTVWQGGITDTTHQSSWLVCRTLDGKLKYEVNCKSFGLDTSPNFLGDSSVITRCRPAILGSTLYLVNAVMSNIGPQLYAIDKNTGKLKWACAYYTPPGAPSYITKQGDYSQFRASNMRVSDLCPSVAKINGHKYIFVGTSSYQNTLNVGLVGSGVTNPLGFLYPIYTDQGFLFCIEDLNTTSKLVWQTPTCAPILQVGDTISNRSIDYNPFMPGESVVTIESVSSANNYFSQPYFLANPPYPGTPNTTPFATTVTFTQNSVISVQPIWYSIDPIYQDNQCSTGTCMGYTIQALLNIWAQEQANLKPGQIVTHTIWAYVGPKIVNLAQQQSGNNNIVYFKFMTNGQKISNPIDAQNLNYWGNTTWGYQPHVDLDNNMVYFGSGQAHEIPIDESIYYNQPSRNFFTLKQPVIDTINRYADDKATLNDVNKQKNKFLDRISALAADVYVRSPRSRLSYSDAVFGVYITGARGGKIAFARRLIPWDTYTFLTTPRTIFYPGLQAIDGDCSSGVFKYDNTISTCAKSGLSLILTLSNNDQTQFTSRYVYSGPNSAIGGSNYGSALYQNKMISCQGNVNWFTGTAEVITNVENQVTQDGRVLETNNSFIQTFDVTSGKILWETDLKNRIITQVSVSNGVAFISGTNASIYCLDIDTGNILYTNDTSQYGMNGGIAAPSIANGKVYWINNYSIFGLVGGAGPNGAIFELNNKIDICSYSTLSKLGKLLNTDTYVSWDSNPKTTYLDPALAPTINVYINHQWSYRKGELYLTAQHQVVSPSSDTTYEFRVKNFKCKTLTFYNNRGSNVEYVSIKFINVNIYHLIFYSDGIKYDAWLRLLE